MNTPKNVSLVGLWFHSFHNGELAWQGRVIGKEAEDVYLIQHYTWLGGEAGWIRLVKREEMLTWQFYPSQEDMNDGYEEWRQAHPSQE